MLHVCSVRRESRNEQIGFYQWKEIGNVTLYWLRKADMGCLPFNVAKSSQPQPGLVAGIFFYTNHAYEYDAVPKCTANPSEETEAETLSSDYCCDKRVFEHCEESVIRESKAKTWKIGK